jgi:menaquinone-specific isochorismate synthase
LARHAPLIAAVAPGRAFTLLLDLPPGLLDLEREWSGDRLWAAPDERLFLAGAGSVPGLAAMDASAWRGAARTWARLGARGAPLAFVTVPPHGGEPRLCTPKILLRQAGGRLSLQLNGWRDGDSPPTVARDWMSHFRAMRAPARPCAVRRLVAANAEPDRDLWRARVAAATGAIKAGRFDKVVLARRLDLTFDGPIDTQALARSLLRHDRQGRIFRLPFGAGAIVAASPELLAVKRGDAVVSHALAGTAPRSLEAQADGEMARRLCASPKEQREHAIVADAIASRLRRLCDNVRCAPTPALMRLERLVHLWTPVSGDLRPGADFLDLLAALHPTPAVLGFPAAPSRAFLREIGEERDSLYTGLAGWVDLDGDGEAAVVLRCAFVEDARARLWAGAGIMGESDADAEWAETELKMAGLRDMLGASA